MKTKLLLLLFLANFSIYAQTNLVPNGGFENWTGGTPDNWAISNNVVSSSDAATGQYSAKLSFTTASAKIIAQVPMKAGITYTVKYKYKYLSNNYGGDHPISLKISKDGSATSMSGSSFASNNSWTQKETTFTPDSDLSYDLSISMFSFDSAVFDILIDDVQVYTDAISEEYTQIPDVAFENKLIALDIDSGNPDGQVLTSKISSITSLHLGTSGIKDLTGIQGFVSLESLYIGDNEITTIDLSKNTKLIELSYYSFFITGLSTLDVSNNTLLKSLTCSRSNIKTLDLSKNTLLNNLNCSNNQNLISIDLKSGHNKNILALSLQNPNLKCIQVDDVAYTNANWKGAINPAVTTFSEDCNKTLGLEASVFEKVNIYPNPTKGELTINNVNLEKANVYNSLGQLVKSFSLNSADLNHSINLSGLPKGVYYIYLINQDTASAKKIILE
ncbi:hypothetical protein J2Y38_000996 [Flavobacterium sp. 2755]|uniref:T9SS type A sorting domain-containing protein n=1 Tax=Flavobacterium sp. 2755 TaxID=2817765 RepID=UPI00285E9939|nr:T9SS type A sorting domain-containing protein [Flavobacterium sp. 2755]MDR6760798.1 hypothetical protein [Flavobacterium sp. 2755]